MGFFLKRTTHHCGTGPAYIVHQQILVSAEEATAPIAALEILVASAELRRDVQGRVTSALCERQMFAAFAANFYIYLISYVLPNCRFAAGHGMQHCATS